MIVIKAEVAVGFFTSTPESQPIWLHGHGHFGYLRLHGQNYCIVSQKVFVGHLHHIECSDRFGTSMVRNGWRLLGKQLVKPG